jgi:hypothetical protein
MDVTDSDLIEWRGSRITGVESSGSSIGELGLVRVVIISL